MSYSKDFEEKSDNESGFKRKVKIMEGEAFTPPFSTLGFDHPILGMDDVDRMRRIKLKQFS